MRRSNVLSVLVACFVTGGILACARAASDGKTCATRSAELKVWLQKLEQQNAEAGAPYLTDIGVRLVEHQGTPPTTTNVIELAPGRVWMPYAKHGADDKSVSFGEQLRRLDAALVEQNRLEKEYYPAEASRIAVAVDRDVAWSEVVELTARLVKAGRIEVDWMVATFPPILAAPPGPSSIDAELPTIRTTSDLFEHGAKFGNLSTRLTASCPSAAEVFKRMATLAFKNRPRLLREALPDALVACNCKIDVPAVQALLFLLFGRKTNQPVATAVRTELEAFSKRVMALPAKTTWAEAFPKILQASKDDDGVRFQVR
jgi:hypothetical protein